jgi:hypothetical protein
MVSSARSIHGRIYRRAGLGNSGWQQPRFLHGYIIRAGNGFNECVIGELREAGSLRGSQDEEYGFLKIVVADGFSSARKGDPGRIIVRAGWQTCALQAR